ncbi:MAG TPA: SEC-C domain-containing protein [Candidatus Methylomirabilis sp.]|nr:SEC-C domain-containing protein [Candidatus Methylomirabilis sp.]
MLPTPRRQRHAPCLCGSGRPLSACCLPWEEAFQRLVARLMAFVATPGIQRLEATAAAIFTSSDVPPLPGRGPTASGDLRFLEWLLHDYNPRRGEGPLLGEFADTVQDLSPREEELLLASLLAPARAWEVTEVLAPRGFLVKDLLTGAEGQVGSLGLHDLPIQSDILICRLLPWGRIMRIGAGLIRLPAVSREEMLAYLRTAYQMARPARHVSLEDFLDGAAHLYHHFFLLRGSALGGRAYETVRRAKFAPGRLTYRGEATLRIRAGLDRQMELELDREAGDEARYAWIDLDRAVVRGTVLVRAGAVEVSADTREDLAEAGRYVEACLRGLVQPVEAIQEGGGSTPPPLPARGGGFPHGAAFLSRILDGWPDRPSPLLHDRTPREAYASRSGRQLVHAILLGLERDLARQKRLGRAWADLTPLREQFNLPAPTSPGPAG